MKDKNIHKDHRGRMKAKYEKCGEEAFETHQLMEMLLFSFINRKDTNATAHGVIDLMSEKSIFEISEAELCAVEGIGTKVAGGLKISAECFRRLMCDNLEKNGLESEFSRRLYIYLRMQGKPYESIWLAVLSRKNKVLDFSDVTVRFASGEAFVRDTVKKAKELGGDRVILCHSHGNGTVKLSAEDLYMTSLIKKKLEGTGVKLLSHYVVTDTDCAVCGEEEEL